MTERIREISEEVLSNAWATLKRYTFSWKTFRGPWQRQIREVYDRGDGVAVLMYNSETGKILMVTQFRLPTYLNGNKTGLLPEVPAGILDTNNPEDCMIREIAEETGFRVRKLDKVLEVFTSPGAVTEKLHLFACDYAGAERIHKGGGSWEETEDLLIEEYTIPEVKLMMENGGIEDAKTLLLLQYGFLNGLI